MTDLRAMIREILAEELARLGHADSQTVRVETVRIDSDQDVLNFALRVLELAEDPRFRDALAAGEYRFQLRDDERRHRSAATTPRTTASHAVTGPYRLTSGLLTERHVAALDEEQRSIEITPAVRLTPLARDELRRRGINIRRVKG